MREIIQTSLVVVVCLIRFSYAGEDTSLSTEKQSPLFHLLTWASCSNSECDQRCRRLGFTGGVCVNGKCKCDINLSIQEGEIQSDNTLDSLAYDTDRASCSNRECDQRCRRLGFTGGVCVNGKCKCDINRGLSTQEGEIQPDNKLDPLAYDTDRASCDNRECDQRCRRLGFTGGVCVNGKCKCDINRGLSTQEGEIQPDNKLDSLAYDTDRASCNNRECDQRCRRLGFTGGVCVNGKCKCDINRGLSSQEGEIQPDNKLDSLAYDTDRASCNNRECDQRCRRLGFTGGVCVNGKCKCDINRGLSTQEGEIQPGNKLDSLAYDTDRPSCNNRECDQRCRRLGFTGGVCVNGKCKCDINRDLSTQEGEIQPDKKLDSLAYETDQASCNNRECNQRCRRLGFIGGVCVNGKCKCDINRGLSTQEGEIQPDNKLDSLAYDTDRASCNNRECDQRCRRLGFTGGVCVNGKCKCDINRGLSTQEGEIQPDNKLDSLAYDTDRASCNNRECDQRCRRLGFTGGVCVNGKCKCDINRGLSTQEGEIQPDNKLDSLAYDTLRASCNNRECDQRCRRLGFTGGVCVNGKCKCDINRGLSTQEDEIQPDNKLDSLAYDTDRASCNNRECDQRCRRLGFTGGVCVNGKCKCEISRGLSTQEGEIQPDNKLDSLAYDTDRASCNNRECDQRCRRLGFTGGVCVNGKCKCDINFSILNIL